MATIAVTLTAIGDAEQQDRSRLTKLEALRNLLTDAESTLEELERQQARSKPLYDSGLIRLEKSRKNFNGAIDKVLSSWDEVQSALSHIADDALAQTGVAPYARTVFPMESEWLRELGKIAAINGQGYFPVIRVYEFDE